MDDPDGTYAPQSPDLSAYNHSSFSPDQSANSYHPPQQQPYPISRIPPTNFPNPFPYAPPYASRVTVQTVQDLSTFPTIIHAKNQMQHQDDGNDPTWAPGSSTRGPGRKGKRERVQETCEKPAPGVAEGIEVKTKFPVARIKRIMQADEDVGKVAQVTPTAVSKALELFMISVVSKAAGEARTKGTKRVTAAHLKQAVEKDEQLDFLATIIAKVPDAPTKKDEDSEDPGEGKKRKAGTRKKKKDPDDF